MRKGLIGIGCLATLGTSPITHKLHTSQLEYDLVIHSELPPGVVAPMPIAQVRLALFRSQRPTRDQFEIRIRSILPRSLRWSDNARFRIIRDRPYETGITYGDGSSITFAPPISPICHFRPVTSFATSTIDSTKKRYYIRIIETSLASSDPTQLTGRAGDYRVTGTATFGPNDPRKIVFTAWCHKNLARRIKLDRYDGAYLEEFIRLSLVHGNAQSIIFPLGFLIRMAKNVR